MSAWFPSGKLKDGTLLFGPLKEKPNDDDLVVKIIIDGKPWWVKYSCPASFLQEVEDWARQCLKKTD